MEPSIVAFQAFLLRARPLATGHAREYLTRLTPQAAHLLPWLVSCDLLAIAGLSYAENAYTELVAWALSEKHGEDVALRVQRAWLSALGLPSASLERPLCVHTQLLTDDGIPDLVLQSPSMLVVVEAKIGSTEHTTPTSKLKQTEAYLAATRRTLGTGDKVPGWMVFMTLDRSAPASSEARATSYLELALALATGLSGATLADDVRWAYAMLITHLVTCAVPRGVDFVRCARAAEAWNTATEHELIRELDGIQAIGRLLPLEEENRT